VSALSGVVEDEVVEAARARSRGFTPLRGRLTPVGELVVAGGKVRYVDDGLATSTTPVMAALDLFADDAVGLIAGGFDRGVDYAPLVDALARRVPPTRVVAMGPAGRRLAAALREVTTRVDVVDAATMEDAVTLASDFLGAGGVVLLSPGAPSFDRYHNWEERSEDFTRVVRSRLLE
jgi:UDP-N-acetylmuramoylalanine--D-glutamate ligase